MNKWRVGSHVAQIKTGVVGQRRFELQRPKVRVNKLGFDSRFRSVRHFTDRQQLEIVVAFADPRHLAATKLINLQLISACFGGCFLLKRRCYDISHQSHLHRQDDSSFS